MQTHSTTVTVAAGASVSSSFQLRQDTVFVGALLPSLADGVVSVEASLDDSNFYPILSPADGDDFVAVASGSDAGWIDISDVIRFLPTEAYLRFAMAAQAGGASIKVFMRG